MGPSPLRRRRSRWVAAVAVAAFGVGPAVVSRDRSDAAPVVERAGPAATTPVDEAAAGLPTAAPAAEVTTTSAPVGTTTSSTSPTTTTAAPPTTSTTAARSAAAAAPTRLQQAEAIADSTGFDWRATGLTIHIAYHPEDCCHWGIYDFRDNSLWIGPSAFARPARLRYVVLHELAHAWQEFRGMAQLIADMAPWGYSGWNALEPSADCIARLWGATQSHYWSCPADAEALVARRLAGDWS